MELRDFELTVGDVLEIDGYVVTVVDIDGDAVSFRVDDPETEFPLDARDSQHLPRK